MLLETCDLNPQSEQNFMLCEGTEFSPPKDPLDCSTFATFFTSGSFSLTFNRNDTQQEEVYFYPSKEGIPLETPTDTLGEFDKFSVTDSLMTQAQTDISTFSFPVSDAKSHLFSVNTPNSQSWLIQPKVQDLYIESPREQRDPEFDLYMNSFESLELDNNRLTDLILAILDKNQISFKICQALTLEDIQILKIYFEAVFGLNLPATENPCLQSILAEFYNSPNKIKRNEEKLKKTVKLSARLITQAFSSLNGLEDLTESVLISELGKAYFGEETNLYAIFSGGGLSQKTLGRAAKNTRFAGDFGAILQTQYMPAALNRRQSQVFKTVASIRHKLRFKEDVPDIKLVDLVKRTPWPLSDLVDGAKLCLQILEKK